MFLSLGFFFFQIMFLLILDWKAWEAEAQKVQTAKVAQEEAAKSASELEQRNEKCDVTWNCMDRSSFKNKHWC